MEATWGLLDARLEGWDVFAPYPCEPVRLASMRRGDGRSRLLSRFAVMGGVLGGIIVLIWLYLTQVVWSDLLISQGRVQGGESWYGYVIPVFEGILLGAGLFVSVGFLWASRLPRWFEWVAASDSLSRNATSASFFIVVDSSCKDEGRVVLERFHPLNLEWVEALPEREGGNHG